MENSAVILFWKPAVVTFQEELARLQRECGRTAAQLKDQFASVERKLEGVLRAIENGAWNDSLQERLNELEAQQAALREKLQAAAIPAPVVRLHPNAVALYAAKVADLQAALNQPDIRLEAMEALQTLIERIVLTPDESAPDRLAIELHGDLAMILHLAAASPFDKSAASQTSKNPRDAGVSEFTLSVVAGARNRLDLLLSG